MTEIRRVLRPRHCAAVCVISMPERAPMWGVLAAVLSQYLPEQRDVFHLAFALSGPWQLERLFDAAGFRDVRVTRETRETLFESFDDRGVLVCPFTLGLTAKLPPGRSAPRRLTTVDRAHRFTAAPAVPVCPPGLSVGFRVSSPDLPPPLPVPPAPRYRSGDSHRRSGGGPT